MKKYADYLTEIKDAIKSNPEIAGALLGGTVGGVGGGLLGGKNKLRNSLIGAGVGGATGAGIGAGYRNKDAIIAKIKSFLNKEEPKTTTLPKGRLMGPPTPASVIMKNHDEAMASHAREYDKQQKALAEYADDAEQTSAGYQRLRKQRSADKDALREQNFKSWYKKYLDDENKGTMERDSGGLPIKSVPLVELWDKPDKKPEPTNEGADVAAELRKLLGLPG